MTTGGGVDDEGKLEGIGTTRCMRERERDDERGLTQWG